MAAPTSRLLRLCSPSLPGLARRLRSAAHSSSGRRHVRPGAGAPARPAQPPQPPVARGPILPPLSAWGGGSPPAPPVRVGSGRDGVGWQRGQTPSPPPPSSRQRYWGSRGRGWGGGPTPPRRRPQQGGPTAVATACEGRRSPAPPGARGAAGSAPQVSALGENPSQPRDARARERAAALFLRGAPRARSRGTGNTRSPRSSHGSRCQNLHTHTSAQSRGSRDLNKAGKPESKAHPWPGKQKCHKLRNGADRKISVRCILPQVTTRAQLLIQHS